MFRVWLAARAGDRDVASSSEDVGSFPPTITYEPRAPRGETISSGGRGPLLPESPSGDVVPAAARRAEQVVSQGVPQGDRLGLIRPPAALATPPPPRCRPAWGRAGRLEGPSAGAPARPRCNLSPGRSLSRSGRAARTRRRPKPRSVPCRRAPSRASPSAPSGPRRRPSSPTSTPTITWLAVAGENGTWYAGRNPPSALVITVAVTSVVARRAVSFSPDFFLASRSGNRSHAALP